MNSKIVFNKDVNSATIYLMKVFSIDVSALWDHFTTADLLDQWWIPKPSKCQTIAMNFEQEGSWNYAIIAGNNQKQFAGVKYHEINFHRSFDWSHFVTDEAGNIDRSLPSANWLIGFTGVEEGSKLTVNIHFPNGREMDKVLQMDFEKQIQSSLNQLEDLLNKKD